MPANSCGGVVLKCQEDAYQVSQSSLLASICLSTLRVFGLAVGSGVVVGVGIPMKFAVTVKLLLRATVVVAELELPTAPAHPEKVHPALGEAAMFTNVPQW